MKKVDKRTSILAQMPFICANFNKNRTTRMIHLKTNLVTGELSRLERDKFQTMVLALLK